MEQFGCDAIIFDLDGVLVDSSAVIERHWKRWAARHGVDLEQVMRLMHGRRAAETMRLVAPGLDVESEAEHFQAAQVPDTQGLQQIEGAARLVGSLPTDAWAVATSATREIAVNRLDSVGLPVPRVLVAAEDVERGKPAPDAYLLAAAGLSVSPGHCIVVEDAPAGVEGAKAAGMQVVAVTTTHERDDLGRADAVADDLSDLKIVVDDHSADVPGQPHSMRLRLSAR